MLQATYSTFIEDVYLCPHELIQMVTEPGMKWVMAKMMTIGEVFCSWARMCGLSNCKISLSACCHPSPSIGKE